jgi:putative ABC transport system ATP-binding protein
MIRMILEFEELSKQFIQNKKMNAIDQGSLQIKIGELTSIMGHSESGKIILFHLITGLLKPTADSVHMHNIKVVRGYKQRTELRSQDIAYVLQEQNLLRNYTILENVSMPYYINRKRNLQSAREKAETMLERVGLLGLRNAFPHEISDGEAKRVTIARALMNDPVVLIAEEPTSNLDSENSRVIIKLFREISDSGVAVVVSTYDYKFLDVADRIFHMKKGRMEEWLKKAKILE